ncbi:DNA repair protein rad18 [Stipitochalara longipes BDJ]|nr:DNA repair protein rad18 [Stipitochalara longipes BDJ]
MNKPSKEEAFDLSDSTDWLKTPLPLLSSVDSALRCQVCKDFYTTPMITSCAHTFCSLCIRRCLNNDGRCPACRAQDQELKLRFNAAMEDLVEAFKKARPEVWEFANKPVEVVRAPSPKRSRELVEGQDESPRKLRRTRSSGRNRPREEVVDSAEDDDDYVPEDGFVQCPVCQKSVKEDKINAHLDRNCEDEPQPPTKTRSKASNFGPTDKPIPRPERLPQLHYSMVKDNILRKKLADLGISTGGTRQQLEKRYTEWVALWNANCDATKPKGKSELKRELDIWERTQGSRAGSSKDSGAQIREKDFDGQAWSSTHEDTFRQLIANARKKVPVKPTTPTESKSDMVDLTGSPSPMKIQNPPESPAKIPEEPVETHEDTDMSNDNLPPQKVEESPTKQPSQRRFFEESTADCSELPPSSQYSGIASDMTTIRPIQ